MSHGAEITTGIVRCDVHVMCVGLFFLFLFNAVKVWNSVCYNDFRRLNVYDLTSAATVVYRHSYLRTQPGYTILLTVSYV